MLFLFRALIIHKQRKVRQNAKAQNKPIDFWKRGDLSTRLPLLDLQDCYVFYNHNNVGAKSERVYCLIGSQKKKLWVEKCCNNLDLQTTAGPAAACSFQGSYLSVGLFCLCLFATKQRKMIFFFFFSSATAKKIRKCSQTRGNAGGMTHWDRFRSHFLMKEDKQIKKKFLRDFQRGKY